MMPRFAKILLIVFFVLVTIVLLLCGLGYRLATRSLPKTQGEIVLGKLQERVRVYRDAYHVPHIVAKNEHDLFFAQGFVTAQDRLWQMDLWRRAAEGRLSEIFGRSTLKMDSLMLTVGIKRTAQRIVPVLSAESRAIYQAYADGVNSYLEKNANRLPLEFTFLNYRPSSWEIGDCIAITRWFAWQSSNAWKTDATLGAVVEKIGLPRAEALFPSWDKNTTTKNFWNDQKSSPLFEKFLSRWESDAFLETGCGSNSWVVSGERSATGKPLLANDPHLSLTSPSIFYETHLVGGGFQVSGLSLPGLPGVIIGQNANIAWGLTNLMADDLDLFVETLHPADSTQYLWGGTYRKIEVVEEEIPIKAGPSLRMKIFLIHHGPVVSDVLPAQGQHRKAVSLRWTGHEVSDEGLAYSRLNRASDWDAFQEALRSYGISPQNFIYADREGNIGLQAAGKIPIRTGGLRFLPQNGQDPEADWKGWIPFEDLPAIKNPPAGCIATANNKMESRTLISDVWALPSRIERIRHLLSEKETFSVMDFKQMQTDVLSPYAKETMDWVLPGIRTAFPGDSDVELLRRLSSWDGEMRAGSLEAAFFEVFLQKLLSNLLQEELGDSLFASYMDLFSIPLAACQQLIKEPHSPWFANLSLEEQIKTKNALLIKSFKEATAFLKGRMGDNLSRWSWGELHALVFAHPLGTHPLLGRTYNLGPFHIGGSGTTVNCLGYAMKKPYDVVWGTSARLICDLGNPDNFLSVIPTGQSGQPMDKHYRDQLELYLNNLYHPNLMDTARIVQSDWNLLILKPEGSDE